MENENEDVSKKLKREMECLDKNKREMEDSGIKKRKNGRFRQKEKGEGKVWAKKR